MSTPRDHAWFVATAIFAIVRECPNSEDAFNYVVNLLRDEFADVRRQVCDDLKTPSKRRERGGIAFRSSLATKLTRKEARSGQTQ
jgi:hypothetical protein